MKRRMLSVILCTAMVVSLGACGSSSSSSSTTTEEEEAAEEEEEVVEEETTETSSGDGVLDVGTGSGLDSLTPFRSETGRDAVYMEVLCESLAILDEDGNLLPWIATGWSTEDDGFTYEVTIHEGITDSAGNSITAADLVWYIEEAHERALKPVFGYVESVEQTGDYTFTVSLSSNVVGTFDKILTDTYAISQAEFEASEDEFGTYLVSTSPYVVTEFIAQSTIALELRDDYWQDLEDLPEPAAANVEKVTFHTIGEDAQQGTALETGIVDIAYGISTITGSQYEDNDDYVVEKTIGHQGYTLFFSGAETSQCAEDVALRQAICYAIDVEGLVTGICGDGYGSVMYDAHSSIMVGYNEKWEDESYYEYDPDKAEELLAESGYNGETLILLCNASDTPSRIAQMIQNYCAAVGINIELYQADSALLTSIRLDGTQYDMFINTIGGTYLSDAWAIRYDPAAYEAGDATSRNDYDLAELLYTAWTPEGWTEENIDAVHYYLKDMAISYGLCNPDNMSVWTSAIGLTNEVHRCNGLICPTACTYTGL